MLSGLRWTASQVTEEIGSTLGSEAEGGVPTRAQYRRSCVQGKAVFAFRLFLLQFLPTMANLNTGHFIEWLVPCHSKYHTNGNMPGGYFTQEPSNVHGCCLGAAVPALPWVPQAGNSQSLITVPEAWASPVGSS